MSPPERAPAHLGDYAELARSRLDAATWDYIEGGSGDEVTLRRNREAFGRVRFFPRLLANDSQCTTVTHLLGTPVAAPVLVAPLGFQCLVHPEGERATARAAAAAGTVMVASTMASVSLEETAATAPKGVRWFQLYCFRDRGVTRALVERAAAAGYRALVLTADVPRLGARERDLRNAFALPSTVRAANLEGASTEGLHKIGLGSSALADHAHAAFDPALTWESIDWLRSLTPLPLVIKGVMTAEDARTAADRGAAAVIVSNHGGRQLDFAAATMDVLSEVTGAVENRCEVYVDGGFSRGAHVLAALALGARAVLVGRPVLWGLAVGGEAGVGGVLTLLRNELELAMALAGCPNVGAVRPSLVRLAPP